MDSIRRYPVLKVGMALKTAAGRVIPIGNDDDGKKKEWIKVGVDTEYTLTVTMRRANPFAHRAEGNSFAPR